MISNLIQATQSTFALLVVLALGMFAGHIFTRLFWNHREAQINQKIDEYNNLNYEKRKL